MSFGSIPMPAPSPVGPDPSSSPSSPSKASDQWWMVRFSNGSIGLERGTPQSNVVHRVYVASASDFNDLLNNHAQALGNAQGLVGASTKQLNAFIAEIDHGAGLGNPNWLYVGPDSGGNQVSSNVGAGRPTLGSEASGTSLIPGTSGIVNALSNLGPANILGVLGNLQFWKGIGLVLGGVVILVIVGREAVRL